MSAFCIYQPYNERFDDTPTVYATLEELKLETTSFGWKPNPYGINSSAILTLNAATQQYSLIHTFPDSPEGSALKELFFLIGSTRIFVEYGQRYGWGDRLVLDAARRIADITKRPDFQQKMSRLISSPLYNTLPEDIKTALKDLINNKQITDFSHAISLAYTVNSIAQCGKKHQ